MKTHSVWQIIRRCEFDLDRAAAKLHELGMTTYDIALAPIPSDLIRADLIQKMEEIQRDV